MFYYNILYLSRDSFSFRYFQFSNIILILMGKDYNTFNDTYQS